MKKTLFAVSLMFVLSACTVDSQEQVARSTAKRILTPIAKERFPGLPTDIIVNCAVDNANLSELINLGTAAATGQANQTATAATQILVKPEATQCIAKSAINNLLKIG